MILHWLGVLVIAWFVGRIARHVWDWYRSGRPS